MGWLFTQEYREGPHITALTRVPEFGKGSLGNWQQRDAHRIWQSWKVCSWTKKECSWTKMYVVVQKAAYDLKPFIIPMILSE